MSDDFKEELIDKITEKGFPVIVYIDYADGSAMIYIDADSNVFADDYGGCFIEPGKYKYPDPMKVSDITEEGLFKIYKYGVRPGGKDAFSGMSWKELIDYFGGIT